MTKCKKTRDFLKTNIVDIIGIFVAIVGIVVAIIIGWKTCEISKNQELIGQRSESIMYSVTNGTKGIEYAIDGRVQNQIKSYKPVIKVKRGIIDVLKVIKYNEKEFKILGQPKEELMDKYRLSKKGLQLTVEQNITKDYGDTIFYDYFFVYIKSGDGSEHLDLIYTKINLNNTDKVLKPVLKTKLDILENTNNDKGYLEMMNSYKKLLKEIDKLSSGQLVLY